MSTRHIVRIAPLHTSILITFVYSLVAALVVLTGSVFLAIEGGLTDVMTSLTNSIDTLLAGALLNILFVFLISLLISGVYNLLAKHLGGIEITLDDD